VEWGFSLSSDCEAMAGSRSWSMESKEFKMMINGGATGVRIVQYSKGKQ
jgi:hypothetical protein